MAGWAPAMIDNLRTGAYEVLALGFRRPAPAQVEALAGEGTRQLLSDVADLLIVPQSIQWQQLGQFCEDVETRGAEAVAAELLVEYNRLFLGPGTLLCPPYGSIYLDGTVMGPSTLDVVRRYRGEGLKADASWKEPPDHIALEIAFMAALAARYHHAALSSAQPEALTLLRAQHDFLSRHLGHWGPQFAEKLAENASLPLYRFLASFLSSWLPTDAELVRAAIGAPEVSEPCA